MAKHLQQPPGSKLCGHCCVAMVLGIELSAAIALIGHEKAVRNRELHLTTLLELRDALKALSPDVALVIYGLALRRTVELING